MRALLLLFPIMSCASCGTREIVVEKPVPVEVTVVEYVPVPPELLQQRPQAAIPDGLTYGQALELWSRDRASLEAQNASLKAIAELEP